jgi:hypothetical protein
VPATFAANFESFGAVFEDGGCPHDNNKRGKKTYNDARRSDVKTDINYSPNLIFAREALRAPTPVSLRVSILQINRRY